MKGRCIEKYALAVKGEVLAYGGGAMVLWCVRCLTDDCGGARLDSIILLYY